MLRLSLRGGMSVVVHVGDGETNRGRSGRGGRGVRVGLRWGEVLVVVAGRRVEVDVERMLALVCGRRRDGRCLVCKGERRRNVRISKSRRSHRTKGRVEAHASELRSSGDSTALIPSQADASQHRNTLLPIFLQHQRPFRSPSKLRERLRAKPPPSSSSSFRPRSSLPTPSTSFQLPGPASPHSDKA